MLQDPKESHFCLVNNVSGALIRWCQYEKESSPAGNQPLAGSPESQSRADTLKPAQARREALPSHGPARWQQVTQHGGRSPGQRSGRSRPHQLPSACATSQPIGRDAAAPWEGTAPPTGRAPCPSYGQIQSGCLAQMTHKGKGKAFWSVLA